MKKILISLALFQLIALGSQAQNNALSFSGVGAAQVISVPGLATNQPAFTLEFWVKPSFGTVSNNKFTPICFNEIGGNPTGKFFVQIDAGGVNTPNMGFSIQYFGTGNGLSTTATIPRHAWSHIALSANPASNNLSLYINGVLITTSNSVNYLPDYTTGAQIKLGAQVGGGEFMFGSLDEVRVWQGVRTATEIAQNYAKTMPSTTPGLLVNLPFDETLPSTQFTNSVTGLKYNRNSATYVTPGYVSGPRIAILGNNNIILKNTTPNLTNLTEFITPSFAPKTQTYTIKNVGTTTLGVSGVSISGIDASEFTVFGFSPSNIPVGGISTFDIQFLTNTIGTKNALVSVASDDIDDPNFVFSISGAKVDPAGGLKFDGIDDYLHTGNIMPNHDEFSVEMQVNFSTVSGTQYLFGKAVSINDLSYSLQIINGLIIGKVMDSNNVEFTATGGNLSAGGLYHLVMTYQKGVGLKIYANGQLNAVAPVSNLSIRNNPSASIIIGTKPNDVFTPTKFAGIMYDFRYWSRTLSLAEVQSRSACQVTNQSANGLVINYDFNQGFANSNNTNITHVINRVSSSFLAAMNGFERTGTTSNFVEDNSFINSICGNFLYTDLRVFKNNLLINTNQTLATTTNGTDMGIVDGDAIAGVFELRNTGLETVTITSPTVVIGGGSSAFTFTLSSDIILPNGSVNLYIGKFFSVLPGSYSSNVVINSSDMNAPAYSFQIAATFTTAGTALIFDGIDDYTNTNYSTGMPTGNSDFSVEMWVNNVTNQSGDRWFGWFGTANQPDQMVTFGIDGSTNNIKINRFSAEDWITNINLPSNSFNHLAFVYRGSTKTMEVYINSGLADTKTYTGVLNLPSSGTLQLGTYASNLSMASNIIMDEVRIWNRALNSSEILDKNNCNLQNTFPGLALHYNFNQHLAYGTNTGQNILFDRSTRNLNSTLTNFSLVDRFSNWVIGGQNKFENICPTVSNATFSVTGNGNLIANNSTTTSIALNNDFGTRLINGSVVRTFRIHNGNDALVINNIGSNSDGYEININTPLTIAANSTFDLVVSFSGFVICEQIGDIEISTNSIIMPTYKFPVSGYVDFNDYPVLGTTSICGSGVAVITVGGSQLIKDKNGIIQANVAYNVYNSNHTKIAGPLTFVGESAFTVSTPTLTSTTGFYITADLIDFGITCIKTLSGIATITILPLPTISGTASPTTVCKGQPITFLGFGGDTYLWQTPEGNTFNTASIEIRPTISGKYFVQGKNTSNCSARSTDINISVELTPEITFDLNTKDLVCEGEKAKLSVLGALNYTFTGGITNDIFFNISNTTTYTISGDNAKGCVSSVTKTVTVLGIPSLLNIPSSATYGQFYQSQLSTMSGLNYSITSGDIPLGLSLTLGSITGIPNLKNEYNFTITSNISSCASSKDYTITVNPALLTVKVRDTTVFQNSTLPLLSSYKSNITGLALGESLNISYFTNATNTNTVGDFFINPLVTGATLSNYILTTLPGTLQVVSPQVLTVRGLNVSREYGSPDPIFDGTVLGINPAFGRVSMFYYTNTNAQSNFGVYPILASITGLDANRYSLFSNTVAGLTIRTRRLIVRTFDYTIAKGQAIPVTFPHTILGLLPGANASITFDTEAVPNDTNKLNIIPEIAGLDLNFYSLVLFPGVLYIKPAVSLVGANFTKVYGQVNPSFSGRMVGVKPTEPYVYVSYRTDATAESPIGDYPIYPIISGSDALKYGYVTVLGTLSITKAPLSVTAANQTRLANNTTPFEFTPVIIGKVGSDDIQVSFTTNAPDVSTTGSYLITPSVSGTGLDNYNLSTSNGTLNIATVIPPLIPVTILADNFTRKYGEAEGNYTFSTIGTIDPNDKIIVTIKSNASLNSPIGNNYSLTPQIQGADINKYIFTTVVGELTIKKNTITVQALDYTRVYGTANPPFFNASVSGLLNGDQLIAFANVNANQFANVGTYPIFVQILGAVPPNYDLQTVAGTLSITKAILTVIGSRFQRMYNQPNPILAFNIVGYKGSDQIGVINKLPIGQTIAIRSSPVQPETYPVVYSQAEDNNYDFAYIDGSLKINPATQTIVGFNSFARVKTGESVTLTANATSGLPIEVSSLDTNIVKNTGLLMNGKTDGVTFIKLKQPGNNNYLAADSALITVLSTSTGIKTTTLIGMFGSRSMFKGVQSTFQSTQIPGYKYVWSYRPSTLVPRMINWVNPLDTLKPKVSIVFPTNAEITLPNPNDSNRVYIGDIICKVYDDLGNLSKTNQISLLLTVDSQAAALAQLAQTLATLECPPAVTNCNKTFISTFNFGKRINDGAKDKTDKSCNGGFSDFTASGKIDTLIMGNPYNFKIGATVSANTSALIFFALWIDYDNNGSYNDPDDFIRASSEATNLYEINSMAIRNNDKYEGPRRIRISMKTSKISPSESCLDEGVVGETEDYMVFLKKPQALEAANLLTPNDDGKNDLFIIKGINPKLTNKFTVMDKYGIIKYTTENYQNDFDGNASQNKLQDGTYYFYFSQGEEMLKGFFELRRK